MSGRSTGRERSMQKRDEMCYGVPMWVAVIEARDHDQTACAFGRALRERLSLCCQPEVIRGAFAAFAKPRATGWASLIHAPGAICLLIYAFAALRVGWTEQSTCNFGPRWFGTLRSKPLGAPLWRLWDITIASCPPFPWASALRETLLWRVCDITVAACPPPSPWASALKKTLLVPPFFPLASARFPPDSMVAACPPPFPWASVLKKTLLAPPFFP